MNVRRPLIDSIKENPVVSVMIGIAFVGATVTGALSSVETFDELIATEAEVHMMFREHEAHPHKVAAEAIEYLKSWNRCDRLERKMAKLEDRMWQAEQGTPPNPVTIRNIRMDQSETQRRFNALECGRVLAG